MSEITRFRVEGKRVGTDEDRADQDKQMLIDFLAGQAERMMGLLDQNGEWECTDDVITRLKNSHVGGYHGYSGRMVFQFHPKETDERSQSDYEAFGG